MRQSGAERQRLYRARHPHRDRTADKLWRQRNRDKVNAAQRRYMLKHRYNITEAEVDALLEAQNGLCAICKEPQESALHIDHCHSRQKVRGLLCENCNRGLGMFRDSKERLLAAIVYLENSNS
jgi:hypothetical protein